ncbi:hypothetical protein AYI70_g12209 [Smittium culicis]|uniref:Uncharacterized protein n=1 Tax=Smittium culicis TaxID=133412 RepID=A0A1R1WYH3_9FUNG|nr:hypothetical protein AYI70_g12209 [Smittium culicis]
MFLFEALTNRILAVATSVLEFGKVQEVLSTKCRILSMVYLFLCSNCLFELAGGNDLWPLKCRKRGLSILYLILELKDKSIELEKRAIRNSIEQNTANDISKIDVEGSIDSSPIDLDLYLDSQNLQDLMNETDKAERQSKESKRAGLISERIDSMLDKSWIPILRSTIISQCSTSDTDFDVLTKRIQVLVLMVSSCVDGRVRSWDSFYYIYGRDSLDVIRNCYMRRRVKAILISNSIPKMNEPDFERLSDEIRSAEE